MNTGSYYEIGSTHNVCEDYAISGNINDDIAFAIVCDGCSASDEVDVGARIVAHCAKDFLFTFFKGKDKVPTEPKDVDNLNASISHSVIKSSLSIGRNLHLGPCSLDATLVVLMSDKDNSICFVFGDGGLVTKGADGLISYRSVRFESGAPYYLSYMLDEERQKAYTKEFGKNDDREFIVEVSLEEFNNFVDQEEDPSVLYTKQEEPFDADNIYKRCTFVIPTEEIVAVVSDGVHSYGEAINFLESPQTELVRTNHLAPINSFLDFKNTNGDFVFRRMNRFGQICQKHKIFHADDISVSVISTK